MDSAARTRHFDRLCQISLMTALACGGKGDGDAGPVDDGALTQTSGMTTDTGDAGETLDDSAGDTLGDGDSFGDGDGTTDTAGPTCNGNLAVVYRDFSSSHPDFEGATLGLDPGIVEPDLGVDGKPVYAGNPSTPTTTGQAEFDQWFRDVPSVNVHIDEQLTLTEVTPGNWMFDDSEFFPLDGLGMGDEGNIHNYHFTLELHTRFTYGGGELFTFTGDDDLFVFVNDRLGADLGGVHGPAMATIDMDGQAADLGITPGNDYSLDFFFAERHTSQSNFRIETSIECFVPPK